MADNLQNRIYSESSYKSGGERKIAQFLEKMNISFTYERPMLIVDKQNKQRIYYPDFWLNDYHIAIEYFGLTGSDKNYDKITQNKQEVYNSMQIDLVPLYPDNFKLNWQNYIVENISDILENRCNDFNPKAARWKKLSEILSNKNE